MFVMDAGLNGGGHGFPKFNLACNTKKSIKYINCSI